MARIFVYEGCEFPDHDPQLSVEEVRKQLGDFFPELANAETREEQRDEGRVYTFTRRIGANGIRRLPRPRRIVAILRRVPEKRLPCSRSRPSCSTRRASSTSTGPPLANRR